MLWKHKFRPESWLLPTNLTSQSYTASHVECRPCWHTRALASFLGQLFSTPCVELCSLCSRSPRSFCKRRVSTMSRGCFSSLRTATYGGWEDMFHTHLSLEKTSVPHIQASPASSGRRSERCAPCPRRPTALWGNFPADLCDGETSRS